MKKICCYVHQIYQDNRIFDPKNETLNRNDILAPYRHIKQIFRDHGYEFNTQDITPALEADAVLYLEMPPEVPNIENKQKSYLFACETNLIRPRNWIPALHKHFKTVFTVIEYKNPHAEFIKVNFPQIWKRKLDPVPFSQKKLCTLIAGAKLSLERDELYSERIKWINWFTAHHPTDFDFYGTGWNKLVMIGPLFLRIFNKIPGFFNIFRPKLTNYKGVADDKYAILNKYKFSICFENVKNINGNLSEKIFDCFFSNNIPIYWGALDILKYVPKDCFIDPNNFDSMADLHLYMNKMSESQYNQYLFAAREFLNSARFNEHSLKQFADAIALKIIADLE